MWCQSCAYRVCSPPPPPPRVIILKLATGVTLPFSLSPKKQPFSLSRYVIIVIIMHAYLFSAPLCLFAFINLIRKVSFVARIGFRFIICATFVAREETMRDVADPNQPRNKSTLLDKPNLIFVCEEKWQKATWLHRQSWCTEINGAFNCLWMLNGRMMWIKCICKTWPDGWKITSFYMHFMVALKLIKHCKYSVYLMAVKVATKCWAQKCFHQNNIF